jgi:2-polyprenyl-3-methyl-5-hydroxy-6-metoxy-1,4-benzoquinol methylase
MISIVLTDRNKCAICESREATVHIPFPEIPVVRCLKCDFIYSSKIMAEPSLLWYYENNFGSLRHMQGQIVNARINSWVISKLVDLRKVSNVLDVGTGYGFFLKALHDKYGLDVVGIELSRQEAQHANTALGLKVINSALGDAGLDKRSFDLVTTFEVIEHVPNPLEFIRELAEYVRPGGHLLIMTDNFSSRMVKSLGAGFPKWIPHSHVSHFSSRTLKRAIEGVAGLEVVRAMSYTPWESLLRNAYYKIRGIHKSPTEAFDLRSALEGEMRGTYRHFYLRKLVNRLWAQLACSDRLDGDLVYLLSTKSAQ